MIAKAKQVVGRALFSSYWPTATGCILSLHSTDTHHVSYVTILYLKSDRLFAPESLCRHKVSVQASLFICGSKPVGSYRSEPSLSDRSLANKQTQSPRKAASRS